MPGGIDGALKPVPFYPAAVQDARPETARKDAGDFQAVYDSLAVCFPDTDPATIKSWTEELFTRVAPPHLDLKIDIRSNMAFVRCVETMSPEVWQALQNYALESNALGLGITSVSIGESVVIDDHVAKGLAQLGVKDLALERSVSRSLLERLERAGVVDATVYDSRPKAPRQSRSERSQMRDARRDFAMDKSASRIESEAVTRNLIEKAHGTPSKLDRPIKRRLALEIGKGKRPPVRGVVRAVISATDANLDVSRKVDLLMARAPSSKARDPKQSQPAASGVKSAKRFGELLQGNERTARLVNRAPRKVFVPELSAFVEESDIDEDGDEGLGAPVLHRLCGELPPNSFEQFEAMGAYLEEILQSILPGEHQDALCVSMHTGPRGEMSAARLALETGSPGAAAAIVLAVLESGKGPDAIQRIVSRLGVSPQDVMGALRAGAFERQPWCRGAIMRIDMALAGLELMKGGGPVKLNYGSQDALTAHRMWNETGKLLCSSSSDIELLRHHQVGDRDRQALGSPELHFYLVDPANLAKA
jgi:hypothetical protein